MEAILKTENLSFTYDKQSFVLKDINLSFDSGLVYGIFGKSGAGKSTLLSLLAGLEVSKYGEIYYKNKKLTATNLDFYRCHDIGIVFQAYNLLPQLSAIENVILSMDLSQCKMTIKQKEEKARKLLKRVGLSNDVIYHRVLKLSGGEQQRVAIARALSYDANILLADEPTGNLDAETEDDIIQLFLNIAHKEGKCVIIISHSNEVKKKVDKLFRLERGKIIS